MKQPGRDHGGEATRQDGRQLVTERRPAVPDARAKELFIRVDPELWEEVHGNPIELLSMIDQARLDELEFLPTEEASEKAHEDSTSDEKAA